MDPVRGPTYRAVHEQIEPTALEQLFWSIRVATAVYTLFVDVKVWFFT